MTGRTRWDALMEELVGPLDPPRPANYPAPQVQARPRSYTSAVCVLDGRSVVATDLSLIVENQFDEDAARHGVLVSSGPPTVRASFNVMVKRDTIPGTDVLLVVSRDDVCLRFAMRVVRVRGVVRMRAMDAPEEIVVDAVGTQLYDV